MNEISKHWNSTYDTRGDKVSWHQDDPKQSLELITAAAKSHGTSIIDVGAGASRLADNLLLNGYFDLTLLDVSAVALDQTRLRLGTAASKVTFITTDVTHWQPARRYEVWHDRAVFHFLTESSAQDAYVAALRQGTNAGSNIVLATFALTGPEKCSGLLVQRYSAMSLAERLGSDFALQTSAEERHLTPFGTTQDFTYAWFRRL